MEEPHQKKGTDLIERSQFHHQNTSTGTTHLIECAELVLPWLTHAELASVSSTCKTLLSISRSINFRRSLDASRILEKHPIPFHNPLNDRPYDYFLYAPSQFVSSSLLRQPWSGFKADSVSLEPNEPEEEGVGIECEVEEGVGIIVECGPNCGCGPLGCTNRVTQRRISVKLKVVRDAKKGWGLFADQFIPKRYFICEYAGELVTTEEARSRQKIYDELRSSGRFSSALLVVREHLPSGKACLRINIDATKIGNVGRFINHSCDDGNLSTLLVRSSGSLLPRLCFFASRDIKQGEELTFSYGEIRVRSTGLKCCCGSTYCFGNLPSEDT